MSEQLARRSEASTGVREGLDSDVHHAQAMEGQKEPLSSRPRRCYVGSGVFLRRRNTTLPLSILDYIKVLLTVVPLLLLLAFAIKLYSPLEDVSRALRNVPRRTKPSSSSSSLIKEAALLLSFCFFFPLFFTKKSVDFVDLLYRERERERACVRRGFK